MAADTPIRTDDMLWLLGSVCRIARVPFDAALLAQQFPPPHTRLTLCEAAQRLGFKTGHLATAKVDPELLPLPCIGFARGDGVLPREPLQRRGHLHLIEPGDNGAPDSDPPVEGEGSAEGTRPALLLRVEGRRLVFYRAGAEAPQSIDVNALGVVFESPLMLVSHAAGASESDEKREGESSNGFDTDPIDTAPPRFGLRWFVPELLRHKRTWRDVLLASVSIQLVGLAAPLFTQVLIDKLVVHRTESTLVVVAVALALFTVFTAVMTWLRQHLVLHTGNRIDAVLGSRIFSHLLRLPLPFFEQRTTGVLVARLQGIETIRQFVSGAAVSLLLDLPFLLIFLAVMFHYSWQLSLIALGLLALIAVLSIGIVPVLRARLNRQFMLGARNQSFVTEYVGGIATVKSLQMEPYLEKKYGDSELPQRRLLVATRVKHLQRRSQRPRAGHDAVDPGRRCHPRDAQRRLHRRHAGRVPDVHEPHEPTAAAPGRAVAGVPAGGCGGEAARRSDECAGGAVRHCAVTANGGKRGTHRMH